MPRRRSGRSCLRTAAAWRNGWFHTGDALIRSPDGDYSFVDRLKVAGIEVPTSMFMPR